MFSERYCLKKKEGNIITTIPILLECMPEYSNSHETSKSNIFKYINFASAKRLTPGSYTIDLCVDCIETLEISYDDIRRMLETSFSRWTSNYEKRRERILNDLSFASEEFEKIKMTYEECLKEIDEKIRRIPETEEKIQDLKDEIDILENVVRSKKHELSTLAGSIVKH